MSTTDWKYSLKEISRKTIGVHEPTKRIVAKIYDDKGDVLKTVVIKSVEEEPTIGFRCGDDV